MFNDIYFYSIVGNVKKYILLNKYKSKFEMLETYTIKHSEGITTVKFSDNPNYNQAIEMLDDLVENYSYERVLFDLSISDFDFSS